MDRGPRPWQGLPARFHPEEAGEGEGEDEDEEEDAKGEHDSRGRQAQLLVWTLSGVAMIFCTGLKTICIFSFFTWS